MQQMPVIFRILMLSDGFSAFNSFVVVCLLLFLSIIIIVIVTVIVAAKNGNQVSQQRAADLTWFSDSEKGTQ